MIKYTVFALMVFGLACAQDAAEPKAAADAAAEKDTELRPRIYRRIIPADVLRDFPNHCFASTLCKLFEPDQDWSLEPFCGQSHCHFDEKVGRLFEVVLDCGPKPTNPDSCKVLKSGNDTATFPTCCDVYDQETCKFPEIGAPQEAEAPVAPAGNKRVRPAKEEPAA